jgi:dihydroorotate dehydrogenase
MYSLLKPLLFQLPPEKAHQLVFSTLRLLMQSPFRSLIKEWWGNTPNYPVTLAGLNFRHPVGLAAGFDKDGVLHPSWSDLGFSFAEYGTVTPKQQSGNEAPRLFRLTKDQALINRMGFNNRGVDHLADLLAARDKASSPNFIIGGNIGKNKITPNEEAVNDYLYCMEKLAPQVDYFTINISSPNTPGLRALQEKEPLKKLLSATVAYAQSLPTRRPVFVKIAPDLDEFALGELIEVLIQEQVQGVVATNTTLSRTGLLSNSDLIQQSGGLSGKPLKQKSTETIRWIHRQTNGELPIIGVGGIFHPEDALEKLDAGASLIQLYTGYVYEGPALVRRIVRAIAESA